MGSVSNSHLTGCSFGNTVTFPSIECRDTSFLKKVGILLGGGLLVAGVATLAGATLPFSASFFIVAGAVITIASLFRFTIVTQEMESSNLTVGSGNIAEKTIDLNNDKLSQVVFGATGQLKITIGKKSQLTISADDNLLEILSYEVKGSKLNIQPKGCYIANSPILYHLTIPELTALTLSSTGSVYINHLNERGFFLILDSTGSAHIDRLNVGLLYCQMDGTGSVNISGTSSHCSVKLSGTGNFNATKLKTKTSDIRLSGTGKAFLSDE